MKALLIDDLRSEPEALEIVKNRYSNGYMVDHVKEIDIARDLLEAVEKIKYNNYEMFLVDHDLGQADSDGSHALKFIVDQYLDSDYMTKLPKYVFAVSSNPAGIKKINDYANDIKRLRSMGSVD